MADPAVLLAATSARALAQSARRGGYRPLAVDFFGDQDIAAAAHAHLVMEGGPGRGFRAAELVAGLERLAAQAAPVGVVCGTGFEDRPHLLALIAQRFALYGNDAASVARIKDPLAFATLCGQCGIAVPETLLSPPARPGFLAKRRGGSGGAHVVHAAPAGPKREGFYYQARVPGEAVSALVLADGARAVALGLSAQWTSPAPRQPFRYGGAMRPAALAPGVAARLEAAACKVAAALSLKGLASADFLVDGEDFRIVEVNPRPGATLDIFDDFEPAEPYDSLFARHMAACTGALPAVPPRLAGARACAVVYARRAVAAPAQFAWPQWTADRPRPGIAIGAGEPVCTVHAAAAAAAAALALVRERLASIETLMRGWGAQ